MAKIGSRWWPLYWGDGATVARTTLADGSVASAYTLAAGQGRTLLFASVDVAAGGDNTIVAADAANKIKVVSYVLVADAAVTARWKSGAGTNLSGAMSFVANGGVAATDQPSAHLLETAVNQALILNLGGAIGVRGHIAYYLEP